MQHAAHTVQGKTLTFAAAAAWPCIRQRLAHQLSHEADEKVEHLAHKPAVHTVQHTAQFR